MSIALTRNSSRFHPSMAPRQPPGHRELRRSVRTFRRARVVAVGAASLLVMALRITAPAAAQVQVPAELTVEQAIEIALRNNPGHAQVLNDIDVADARVRASYGSFLPDLTIRSVFSSTFGTSRTTTDEFGRPISEAEALSNTTSNTQQTIGLGSITLFDGGNQFRNVGMAKLERNAAEARISNDANTLRANVIRAYYLVANFEQRIELEQQLLQFARDRLELVQRQFEIAAARQTNLLGAQQEIIQREKNVADAESDVRTRRLELLEVLGISGEPTFRLASELPPVIGPATLDADALVARALENHPNVLQSNANAAVAEKQLSNQRATRLPTISLGLPSYSWRASDDGAFGAWGQGGIPSRSFAFSINASLPLFTGFSTSANIQESAARAEDLREQARQTRLQVEKDVRAALVELGRAHRNLLVAEELASLSEQRLELAQEEYQTGVITFLDLQQIIQQNDQQQRSAIDARFNFLNARVLLEERLGGPLEG